MRAPADLRPQGRGRRFWIATLKRCEVAGDGLEVLHELCRTLDQLDALAAVVVVDGPMSVGSTGQPVAHPAVAESRLQRLVLARLVAVLNLPAPEPDEGRQQPAERLPGNYQTPADHGRANAQKRWHPDG